MESQQSVYLVFIILVLIYGVLDFFAILRTAKLQKFTSEWRHAKIFYLMMILQASFRIAGFIVILVYLSEERDYLSFLMISVPDSLFILNFLMIFWQMISVFRYAHFDHNLEQTLIAALSKNASQSKASLAFLCLIVVWATAQFCLFLSVGLSSLPYSSIYIETGLMNLLLACLTFSTFCLLQRKYSGSPVKSPSWRKRLNRMNYTALVWAACRILRGVIDIIDGYTDLALRGNIKELIAAIAVVFCLIMTEIVCYFLVLDYAFIAIFVLTESEVESMRFSHIPVEASSQATTKDASFYRRSRKFTVLTDHFKLNPKEISLKGECEFAKGKLGKVQPGAYRDHAIAYRTIPFPRISPYMMEEFIAEMDSLKSLEVPYLVPIYGAIFTLPTINLVTPWIEMGSLYTALHGVRRRKLSLKEKYSIAQDLAICLEKLHALGKYHGHLSSHNVLLDSEMNAYVSDLGLHKMKKYAGITIGYGNKGGWTSPDLLKEHFATVMKVAPSDDSYTFGILLWELLTELIPFEHLSRSELIRQVVNQDLRPLIPDHVSTELAKLMKACWASDRTRRPTLSTIAKVMGEETELMSS